VAAAVATKVVNSPVTPAIITSSERVSETTTKSPVSLPRAYSIALTKTGIGAFTRKAKPSQKPSIDPTAVVSDVSAVEDHSSISPDRIDDEVSISNEIAEGEVVISESGESIMTKTITNDM
jgi:hypothetical protein